MERRASPATPGPIRTCVGCRRRAPASELLRVTAVSAGAGFQLLPDPARTMPGRGAHLHPDPACLALAERRRAFGRALRVAGVLDTGELAEYVRSAQAPTGATDGGGTAPPETQLGRTTDMSTR